VDLKTFDPVLFSRRLYESAPLRLTFRAQTRKHAEAWQKYYTAHLNRYLNFHRPCGFATVKTNARGQRKRTYPHQDYRTPFEKLTSLSGWQVHLKKGITEQSLWAEAQRKTDLEAAHQMQKAKLALLARSRSRR